MADPATTSRPQETVPKKWDEMRLVCSKNFLQQLKAVVRVQENKLNFFGKRKKNKVGMERETKNISLLSPARKLRLHLLHSISFSVLLHQHATWRKTRLSHDWARVVEKCVDFF
jgi:hypothetical protein